MWNQEFQNMVWTSACGDVQISKLVLTSYDVVHYSFSIFCFSGQVYVYLRVETHAEYE